MTNMSETIGELSKSLNKAQSNMSVAPKNAAGQVGQGKYKYADFSSVVEAYRKPFADQGLTIIQRPMTCDIGVKIQTMLIHTSGEWIADEGLHLPAVKQDAQAYGSAMTYARRYGLNAMVGIVTDDDDGKAAVDASSQSRQSAQAQAPSQSTQSTQSPPILDGEYVFTFGKNKGKVISQVETSYLEWLSKNTDANDPQYGQKNQALLDEVSEELNRRLDLLQTPELVAVGSVSSDEDIPF